MNVNLNRRDFIHATFLGAASLAVGSAGCRHPVGSASKLPPRVAFNTANLVARVSGYCFELKNWGEQHQRTVAATDERAWDAICQDIAAAGFRAVEIWEAHASPDTLTRPRAAAWQRILKDHGLQAVAYGGHLSQQTADICLWLGIPHIDGSLGGLAPAPATELCRATGVRFNYENHPEKSVAEIMARVGGGNEWLGVCVDTGWLGTQAVAVPDAIRALGPLVRHTHIKDVKAAGAHETCLLGTGVVNLAGAIQALQETGYRGWYSWEDEPEDRNPLDSAARNRQWIEERLA